MVHSLLAVLECCGVCEVCVRCVDTLLCGPVWQAAHRWMSGCVVCVMAECCERFDAACKHLNRALCLLEIWLGSVVLQVLVVVAA
jgi:hypothetical protein